MSDNSAITDPRISVIIPAYAPGAFESVYPIRMYFYWLFQSAANKLKKALCKE